MVWLLAGAFSFTLALSSFAQEKDWGVTSPNGKISLVVQMSDLGGKNGYPAGPAPYYRVTLGNTEVLGASPLGLTLKEQDFLHGLRFERASKTRKLDQTYEALHGKRSQCRVQANERTLVFRNQANSVLEVDMRASDDGVAFRYRLPETGKKTCTLEAEATGFALPLDGRVWVAPSDKATMYAPGYETYYENEIAVGTASPLGVGWSFPLLFRNKDASCWALITEANLGTNFCGTRLANNPAHGVYRIGLPDPLEGNGSGQIQPASTLPWEMPWRVIVLGDSLGAMVESTLVEDLCAPSVVKDTRWIKPGRVAWSWWSDPPSTMDADKQKKFIDLAAEMGWEYYLVDANWTIMERGNVHELIDYAKAKNVGILLWYNSGGPHNIVTEKPRDCFTYPSVRQFEFDLLRKWGVKGVKIDFFQSDKQDVINIYQGILKDAATYNLMLDFHGCTLPRGWSRTYPHLMSMEGIKGAECYIFEPKHPKLAPVQNTISPFTRNAVGPMDYTPVTFSNNKYPHLTTYAHELALAVLFESALLHFADKPEAYRALPAAPKDFLKQVPVAWDDTRFVAGYPGKFVVLARRKGDTWYLAGVNGQSQAYQPKFHLGSWLGNGRYAVNFIQDGADEKSFATKAREISANDDLEVPMLGRGGFVATLKLVK